MKKYSGDECDVVTEPTLETDQKKIVLVVHDECTVYAYEDETHSWVEKGKGHQLKKKLKDRQSICPSFSQRKRDCLSALTHNMLNTRPPTRTQSCLKTRGSK